MKWNWTEFNQKKWQNQKLPTPERFLLVQVKGNGHHAPAVAVGYMRFAAGCSDSPVFTIPGVGGNVVSWCDCLGNDFKAPLWGVKNNNQKHKTMINK